MWPSLSTGQLHCKFDQTPQSYRWVKIGICCSCQYTYSVCRCPIFWGARTTTIYLDFVPQHYEKIIAWKHLCHAIMYLLSNIRKISPWFLFYLKLVTHWLSKIERQMNQCYSLWTILNVQTSLSSKWYSEKHFCGQQVSHWSHDKCVFSLQCKSKWAQRKTRVAP